MSSEIKSKNIIIDTRFKVVVGFILLAVICRLIPHPFNFTPIAAMGLFAGVYISNKKLAVLIPIAAMLLSDVMLQLLHGNGFHDQMIWVYGSIALIASLGFLLRGREQRQTIMVASLIGSILFFIITNFGTWAAGYYPHTVAGLTDCFILAIPFFKGTIMGDLFFNLVLFGGFALVRWASPMVICKKI